MSCVDTASVDEATLSITESEKTSAFVRNFNPLTEVGDVRWPTTRAMYEPMMIHNPITDAYVPWLAKGYRWSADHRTLEFDLREGVQWSDGSEFDADDVRFTFELLREHKTLDFRGVWRFLDRVQREGAHRLRFEFKRPYVPGFVDIIHQPIVPEHIWKNIDNPLLYTNDNPVGTGPFTEVSSFHSQSYRIERNPHYWQKGKPQVQALRFLAFPANDQSNLALINGEVDWAGDFVPAIERIFVERDPEHHHYWFPAVDGTVMLYANTREFPFDRAETRKALSMALDRDLIIKIAMHGYTHPADATGLSDLHEKYRDPNAVQAERWTQYDPKRAEEILDGAGLTRGEDQLRTLPDGQALHLELKVPSGFSDWLRASQVIARNLRDIGLDVVVVAQDFGVWYDGVQRGEFGLAMGWSHPSPTPYGFYRELMSTRTVRPIGTSSPLNWHRFGLESADALLARFEDTTDERQQKEIMNQLQMLFVEHAPAIPLFPGPLWGQYNSKRFKGFPDEGSPYAPLSPNLYPQALLVLTQLEPR